MYTCIPCVYGAPEYTITVAKYGLQEGITEEHYVLVYPVYYEDYIVCATSRFEFVTKSIRWVKRFFKYLRKILKNDIYLVYEGGLTKKNLDTLREIDKEITGTIAEDIHRDFFYITNKLKVNVRDIPFFVLLNFLFNGYIAGVYVKYLSTTGRCVPEYSYVTYKIF